MNHEEYKKNRATYLAQPAMQPVANVKKEGSVTDQEMVAFFRRRIGELKRERPYPRDTTEYERLLADRLAKIAADEGIAAFQASDKYKRITSVADDLVSLTEGDDISRHRLAMAKIEFDKSRDLDLYQSHLCDIQAYVSTIAQKRSVQVYCDSAKRQEDIAKLEMQDANAKVDELVKTHETKSLFARIQENMGATE